MNRHWALLRACSPHFSGDPTGSAAKGVAMFATIRTNSSPCAAAFSFLAVFLALPAATDATLAQESVICWGRTVVDSRWHEQTFVEVAANGDHTVVRRNDGSVVAWGENSLGQCNVPALPPGLSYVEVAAGAGHTVARRKQSGCRWLCRARMRQRHRSQHCASQRHLTHQHRRRQPCSM